MALLKPRDRLAVRVYGQGFGDCILIAVRPDANDPTVDYIVVDCGIFMSTSDRNARLREVIVDVISSTGGKLRVLAITHEHFDHVSGWYQTAKDWDGVTSVDELWQAWTENPKDKFAKSVKSTITYKFKLALGLRSPAALQAMDDAASQVFALNVEFSKATSAALQTAVEFATKRKAKVRYWSPGTVESWSDDLHFVFMGPPKNIDLLYQDFWKSGEPHLTLNSEGRPLESDAQERLMALDNMAVERRLADLGVDPQEDEELARIRTALGLALKNQPGDPFDRRFSLQKDDPRWENLEPVCTCPGQERAVGETLLPPARYGAEPWRKIDGKSAGDLGRLGLQMDNLTNNTSLVFAICLGEEYFLFVGDAQVGNWYGLFLQDYKIGDTKVTTEEIFAKTRFYKVGHHGSHNATVFAKGLDLMPQGLVSIVPTEPDCYNGVPDIAPDGVVERLKAKGECMRTDLAEARGPFGVGPVSPVTHRPLYVEYHA